MTVLLTSLGEISPRVVDKHIWSMVHGPTQHPSSLYLERSPASHLASDLEFVGRLRRRRQPIPLLSPVWSGAGTLPYSRRAQPPPTDARPARSLRRDPLLYNMFEVLISSLDDKFKRVDTIERAIHMVMRHMEIMDTRLQESNNMTASVLSR